MRQQNRSMFHWKTKLEIIVRFYDIYEALHEWALFRLFEMQCQARDVKEEIFIYAMNSLHAR